MTQPPSEPVARRFATSANPPTYGSGEAERAPKHLTPTPPDRHLGQHMASSGAQPAGSGGLRTETRPKAHRSTRQQEPANIQAQVRRAPRPLPQSVTWTAYERQHRPSPTRARLNGGRTLTPAIALGAFLPPAIPLAETPDTSQTDAEAVASTTPPITDQKLGPLGPPLAERVGFLAPRKLVAAATVAALMAVGAGQVATSNIAADVAASSEAAERTANQEVTRGAPRNAKATTTSVIPATTEVPETTTTVAPTTAPPTTEAPTTVPPTTAAPKPAPKAAAPKPAPTVPSSHAQCSKSKAAARDCWMGLIAQYDWNDEYAFNVMWCESKGNPNARNPRSTATGLFQILNGPIDPVANVRLAHQMYSKRGWQPWVCKG